MPSFLSRFRKQRHAAKREKSARANAVDGMVNAPGGGVAQSSLSARGRTFAQSSSNALRTSEPGSTTFVDNAARQPSSTPVNTAKPLPASVPLHELCERCSNFFGEWRALTWLQEHREHDNTSWPILRLCTVAQAVQSAPRCHFCKKLVAHLQSRVQVRLPRVAEHEEVYVHLRPLKEMIEFLVPQPGKKKPNSREEDFQLVAMYRIRAYENGNATAFDSHITAKQVPLCASDNISQAKQWLQCCLTQHQECQRFHTSTVPNPHQRPTRVLEITPTTIRLRCNLKNEPFPYLVLSYMWGTNYSQQLRLLQSNVSAFEKAVPRDQLEASDVYKEAMRVTLALGYKYLWIDSLCIIQDSASDWAHEAQRMAVVYGNATCNLAFLFPPHAPEKPSQRSDPRIWSPCILRHAKGSAPAIYMHDDTTIEFRKEIDNYSKLRDWLVQRDWPLFHRAWTFQEYLLSPRTLLLGHGNLMWHCSHHFYDELLGAIAAPIEPPTNTNTNKTTSSAADSSPAVLFNPKRGKDRGKSRYFPTSIQAVSAAAATTNHAFSNPSILSFLTDWTNIVNEYRGRKLSFEKDRIIAFAGIATAFSHKSKLTYLGGLWAEILPAALLWHVDRKPAWLVRTENNIPDGISIADATWTAELGKDASGADALLPREIQSQLPSWSWFAVPLYKYHETRFLLSDDELFVRCKALSSPHLVHWTDLYSARLVSFTFPRHAAGQVPAGATHMHSFGGVQLRLAAATLGVRDNWAAQLAQRMAAIRRCSPENADGQMSWDPVLEYYADHVGAVSPPKNAVYALLAESQVVRCAGTKTVQRRFAGLMLVPDGQRGGSDECWTRIGVWKLRVNVLRVRVEAANIEAVAGRWGERSLIEGTWRHGVITLV